MSTAVAASDVATPVLREAVLKSAGPKDWATVDFVQDADKATRRHVTHLERTQATSGYKHDVEVVLSASQGWLSAVLAGVLLGLIAVCIEICNHFVIDIRQGVCMDYFWLNRELCCPGASESGCPQYVSWGSFFGGPQARHAGIVSFVAYVSLGTFFAAASSIFCRFYAPFAAVGGINEVKTIVSGSVLRRYFSGWTMCVKAIGVTMSTGSGLQVGKEGPFVHIGACAADIVGSLFPEFNDDGRRRELISAGAAGGIAVAFGAPIGGVIFAVEEISSFYSFRMMMQALMCGVAAVLVLKNFDVNHTGRIVQFSINYHRAWKWFELPLFALLGCFGGLLGSLWNTLNMRCIRKRKQSFVKQYPIAEVAVLAVVSCCINFFAPFCKGGLLGLLANLFQDCEPGSQLEVCNSNELYLVSYMIAAGCIKFVLSFVTVGSLVPAGFLVPCLVIGALFGRAFAIFASSIQSSLNGSFLFAECFGLDICIVPGVYAIVGGAAFLTGVTRMTVCLAVIMFELTGGLEYLVPVIIGILASKATGDALGIESIYELGIEANNMPFLDPKKEFAHAGSAMEVCRHCNKSLKYQVLEADGLTVGQINTFLEEHGGGGFPVVDSTQRGSTLLGYISRKSLVMALQETAILQTKNPHLVNVNTLVRFRSGDEGTTEPHGQSRPVSPTKAAESAPSLMPSGTLATSCESDRTLDYSRFVDSSSIQVPPECSTARLLYLFKSLGSRHVLVTNLSCFLGLITKKDFIKYMRDIEHEEHEAEEVLAHAHKKVL